MKNRNRHIIRQVSLAIEFDDPDETIGLQDKVADVFYDRLQPALEKLFDEKADDRHKVRLDRLEIDCGNIDRKNWEQKWVESAVQKIRSQIHATVRKRNIRQNLAEEVAESLFYYFENGHFPWNNRFQTISELERLVLTDTGFVERLKSLYKSNNQIAKRLAYQFSPAFAKKIIRAFAAQNNFNPFEMPDLDLDQSTGRDQIFITLLQLFSGGLEGEPDLNNIRGNPKWDEPDQPVKTEKESIRQTGVDKEIKDHSNSDSDSAIYIENAGLVILHPFFEELFERLSLVENRTWTEETDRETAVTILQYLVTGAAEILESDLSLNKILCGMQTGDVVLNSGELTGEIKSACDELLRQAIRHWGVLKNTGVQAFRETFLQRNGKLSKVDNGWLLQVEHGTADILLSHLPWGIGVIKTPRMNQLLYTEWT